MSNRTSNYAAFYVKEPFSASNLGANATPDFVYYNQLRAWKAQDSTFPFIDAHAKTYNVRDNSQWTTLKQRLHERLQFAPHGGHWCVCQRPPGGAQRPPSLRYFDRLNNNNVMLRCPLHNSVG